MEKNDQYIQNDQSRRSHLGPERTKYIETKT